MASAIEVERLALALSEHERARLAAKLIESLPDKQSVDDDGAIGYKKVNLSMLRRIRYDPRNRFLDVVFGTGETYRYKDVPLDEYNKLMKAESHGKYMQMHVIDHYETIRLENQTPLSPAKAGSGFLICCLPSAEALGYFQRPLRRRSFESNLNRIRLHNRP